MSKSFHAAIFYWKALSVVMIVASVGGLIYKTFDPSHFIEMNLSMNIFGTGVMPELAKKVFDFPFALFSLVSIITGVFQYVIVKYGLEKKEMWAFNALAIGSLVWVLGAAFVAYDQEHLFYIKYSVSILTLLLIPPLAWARLSMR